MDHGPLLNMSVTHMNFKDNSDKFQYFLKRRVLSDVSVANSVFQIFNFLKYMLECSFKANLMPMFGSLVLGFVNVIPCCFVSSCVFN